MSRERITDPLTPSSQFPREHPMIATAPLSPILLATTEAEWRIVLESRYGGSRDSTPDLLHALERESFHGPCEHDPTLLVLSSGSATGKTHFGRYLHQLGWQRVARHKDRPARTDEVDGIDAHFVDKATFDQMVEQNELVGLTGSYGDRRGYHLPSIRTVLESGSRCVSSDGYSIVRLLTATPSLAATRVLSVFLLPPDIPTLLNRITRRALERITPDNGRTVDACFADEKIIERLREGPRYLRQAFDHTDSGRPLVDRFVVYDQPDRVAKLLGIR